MTIDNKKCFDCGGANIDLEPRWYSDGTFAYKCLDCGALKLDIDANYQSKEPKNDAGKPRLSLVPSQIIREIADVREFGVKKYGSKESWRNVELERYRNAAYRHMLAYIDNPRGTDEESGLSHLSHLACNIAFLCELEGKKWKPQ